MSKPSQPAPASRMGGRRIVLCIGILIMLSVTAFGQLTTGTIARIVTDQSSASVPGATVTPSSSGEITAAVQKGIASAGANSIFDFISASLGEDGVIRLGGFVSAESVRTLVAKTVDKELARVADKRDIPRVRVDISALQASADQLVALKIKEAIFAELYNRGFDMRQQDIKAAGMLQLPPRRFGTTVHGSLSDHPRSFGIFVDSAGNVTVHGIVRHAESFLSMLRQAQSPTWGTLIVHGKVELAR